MLSNNSTLFILLFSTSFFNFLSGCTFRQK
jgi:hypothetical protein